MDRNDAAFSQVATFFLFDIDITPSSEMPFPAALVKMRQMGYIFKSNFWEFYDSFDAWKIHCVEHHSSKGFSLLAMYNDLPRQEVCC